MRAVVQRTGSARVEVDNRIVGEIGKGLLVYLGIGNEDTEKDLLYLVEKLVNLRIFPDEGGKMNRSVLDIKGGILVVSQFTLYADARKGRRPSYNKAAEPGKAEKLYKKFLDSLGERNIRVSAGIFQAEMNVVSQNEGPVTILLDSQKTF